MGAKGIIRAIGALRTGGERDRGPLYMNAALEQLQSEGFPIKA